VCQPKKIIYENAEPYRDYSTREMINGKNAHVNFKVQQQVNKNYKTARFSQTG